MNHATHNMIPTLSAAEMFALEEAVEKAFAFIDKSVRQEFEDARDIVPELVARETKYRHFLLCEGLDPQKAAYRICAHWKGRKVFFGERWLLPMNQTGTGALSMEDIEVLRQGGFVPLQRSDQGFVYLMDESRISRQSLGDTYFRIHYYMGYAAADEPTRKNGTAALSLVNSKPRPLPVTDRNLYELMKAGLHLKSGSTHVVQINEEGKGDLLDFLSFKEARIMEFRAQTQPCRIATDSIYDTLKCLESMGIKREHLPSSVGGDYDYGQFAKWIRMRISVEDVMSSVPIMSNTRLRTGFALEKGKTRTEEETREYNNMRSRRAFHRRQLKVLSLTEQKRVLEARNDVVRRDNARLQGLLADAQGIVSEMELLLDACKDIDDLE